MKIQFKKNCWLVKSYGGGFCGHYNHKAIEIRGNIPFDVVSVNQDGKRISRIHVFSDGACDGENEFLLNVPNELFEVLHESSI